MQATTTLRSVSAKVSAATLFAGILLAFQAETGNAQITNLAPGDNSSAQVNAGANIINNWNIDGVNILNPAGNGVEQLFYSIGSGTPAGIQSGASSITSTPVTQPTPDSQTFGSTYNYTGGQFSLQAVYTLTGSAPGTGTSDFQQNYAIKNLSGGALSFHFFEYANFTIGSGANVLLSEQTVKGVPAFTLAQVNGGVSLSEFIDASLTPGALEGSITPNITALTSTPGYTLPGPASTMSGPGSAWLLEWDVTIGVGQEFDLNKDLNVVVTPEPGPVAFLGLGLVAFGALSFYRRRLAN
jgi:hypothetical protein